MQKHSDINFSAILKAGLALLVLAVIVHIVIWLLFDFLRIREAKLDPKPSPMFQQDQKPPDPQLQVTPVLDLQKFHAAEQNLLGSYDWVDREKGIVRIPVSEAMKLVAAREKAASELASQTMPAEQLKTEDSGSSKQ